MIGGELKTKPTQASIRDLRGLGLSPDFVNFSIFHPLLSFHFFFSK